MGNTLFWRNTAFKGDIPQCVFNIPIASLKGDYQNLSSLRKFKSIMIVNTASQCGLKNSQFQKLQELKESINNEFGEDSFQVIACPSNQFKQEHSESSKIESCSLQYIKSFFFTEPVSVNGDDAHPLFLFLKYSLPEFHNIKNNKVVSLKPIEWNFGKFLIDSNGCVLKYYKPAFNPMNCKDDVKEICMKHDQ